MTLAQFLTSPATWTNVMMHVVLLSAFVAIFFFTYASRVERQVVQKQTNAVVDDFTGDIQNLATPEQLSQLRKALDQYLHPPDMTGADQEAKDKNKALTKKAIQTLSILSGLAILVMILLWFLSRKTKNAFDLKPMIQENLVTLFFVGVTEFLFVTFIAANFQSSDPTQVKLDIVQTLQKYAQK